MEPWATQLATAARYPNVYAKISGLNTAADPETWSAADLKPYIDFASEQFGVDRIIWGADDQHELRDALTGSVGRLASEFLFVLRLDLSILFMTIAHGRSNCVRRAPRGYPVGRSSLVGFLFSVLGSLFSVLSSWFLARRKRAASACLDRPVVLTQPQPLPCLPVV